MGNEDYLLDYADQIKTEKYEENLPYVAGKAWLRKKYGLKASGLWCSMSKVFMSEFFSLTQSSASISSNL